MVTIRHSQSSLYHLTTSGRQILSYDRLLLQCVCESRPGSNDALVMTLFMTASLISPLTTFGHSLTCIGASLAHSVVLVVSAVLNFAITLVECGIQFGRSVVTLLVEMFQCILGLIVAKFIAIITYHRRHLLRLHAQETKGSCGGVTA